MLDYIFNPQSVAIIGASNDASKWGNWFAEDLNQHNDRRSVYVIGKDQSIRSIAEPLDLAVVCVPIYSFENTIDELLEHGTRAIVAITTGFGEKGNSELEQRIANKVAAAGSILIGPNCAGVWDAYSPLHCLPIGNFIPGNVSVISQSGGVIVDLAYRLREIGMGYSKAISVGNQSAVSCELLLQELEHDPNTKLIAMYYENVSLIPFKYISTIRKPVMLYVPWATDAAVRAALKHTNSKIVVAVNVARTMMEFVAAIQLALSNQPKPPSKRTMLVTDSGGLGVIMCTAAEFNSLLIDEPSEELKLRIAQVISPQSTASNPIDLVGKSAGFSIDAINVMRILQQSDEIDCIIATLHMDSDDPSDYQRGVELAQIVRAGGKATIFTCVNFNLPGVRALLDNNIPVLRDAEIAAGIMNMFCSEIDTDLVQ